MKKSVLVVGPWINTGGVHTFMRNLCIHSNLHETWNMVQFNIARPMKQTIDNNQYNFLSSDPKRLVKSILATSKHALHFPIAIRNVDVLQIQASDHYAFWEPLVYAQVAKSFGKPVVVRFGGSFDKFYTESTPNQQKLMVQALQIPDSIVVLSHWWKEYFGQFVDSNKIHVIHNAVPTPLPMPNRRIRTEKPTVLFIAGYEAKRKGIDTMFEMVRRFHTRAKFCFVAVTDAVQELINQAGLTDNIETHPVQNREDLKTKFYPNADIFMLPSFGEGFPNSMLEAMAAGLPTIASDVGAIPEVLIPQKHGFIHPPTDVEGYATSLQYLLDHPEQRHNMGEQSYELVCTEYSLNTVFAQYDTLWKKAIQQS